MNKSNLVEGLKIKSKAGLTIVIDRIVDGGIYTTAWNAGLKNRNRIFWSDYDIESLLSTGGFKYIDDRIKITVKEFYKKFPKYKDCYIEGYVPKNKKVKEIGTPDNKVGDILHDKNFPEMFRVINKIITEDDKIVGYGLTTYQQEKPDENLSFYLSLEDVKQLYSYEKGNKIITKAEVAKLYDLESEKNLVIND